MAGRTVTRAHLIDAINQEFGVQRTELEKMLESILNRITDALSKGESVKNSSFGSFSIRHKAERMGGNPKNGEEFLVSARYVVAFRPSPALKSRINSSEPSNTE